MPDSSSRRSNSGSVTSPIQEEIDRLASELEGYTPPDSNIQDGIALPEGVNREDLPIFVHKLPVKPKNRGLRRRNGVSLKQIQEAHKMETMRYNIARGAHIKLLCTDYGLSEPQARGFVDGPGIEGQRAGGHSLFPVGGIDVPPGDKSGPLPSASPGGLDSPGVPKTVVGAEMGSMSYDREVHPVHGCYVPDWEKPARTIPEKIPNMSVIAMADGFEDHNPNDVIPGRKLCWGAAIQQMDEIWNMKCTPKFRNPGRNRKSTPFMGNVSTEGGRTRLPVFPDTERDMEWWLEHSGSNSYPAYKFYDQVIKQSVGTYEGTDLSNEDRARMAWAWRRYIPPGWPYYTEGRGWRVGDGLCPFGNCMDRSPAAEYLDLFEFARHLIEFHGHSKMMWQCRVRSNRAAGCMQDGVPFNTSRKGCMVRHLMDVHHMKASEAMAKLDLLEFPPESLGLTDSERCQRAPQGISYAQVFNRNPRRLWLNKKAWPYYLQEFPEKAADYGSKTAVATPPRKKGVSAVKVGSNGEKSPAPILIKTEPVVKVNQCTAVAGGSGGSPPGYRSHSTKRRSPGSSEGFRRLTTQPLSNTPGGPPQERPTGSVSPGTRENEKMVVDLLASPDTEEDCVFMGEEMIPLWLAGKPDTGRRVVKFSPTGKEPEKGYDIRKGVLRPTSGSLPKPVYKQVDFQGESEATCDSSGSGEIGRLGMGAILSSVNSPATCMGELSLGSPSMGDSQEDKDNGRDEMPSTNPLGEVPLPKFPGDHDHPDNVNLRNILRNEYEKGLRTTYATLELACSIALEGARAQGNKELSISHKQEMASLETLLRGKIGVLNEEVVKLRNTVRIKGDVAVNYEKEVARLLVERTSVLKDYETTVKDLERKLQEARVQGTAWETQFRMADEELKCRTREVEKLDVELEDMSSMYSTLHAESKEDNEYYEEVAVFFEKCYEVPIASWYEESRYRVSQNSVPLPLGYVVPYDGTVDGADQHDPPPPSPENDSVEGPETIHVSGTSMAYCGVEPGEVSSPTKMPRRRDSSPLDGGVSPPLPSEDVLPDHCMASDVAMDTEMPALEYVPGYSPGDVLLDVQEPHVQEAVSILLGMDMTSGEGLAGVVVSLPDASLEGETSMVVDQTTIERHGPIISVAEVVRPKRLEIPTKGEDLLSTAVRLSSPGGVFLGSGDVSGDFNFARPSDCPLSPISSKEERLLEEEEL